MGRTPAPKLPEGRGRRGRLAERLAIAAAAVAFIIGPAALLGYGRWMDRDIVTVRATQWAYLPNTLYATAGVPLHLRLVSEDVVHGFAIAGLNVGVTELIPGKAADVTFTPPAAGTYYFSCTTYCGLGHGKMFGQLVVRSAPPRR